VVPLRSTSWMRHAEQAGLHLWWSHWSMPLLSLQTLGLAIGRSYAMVLAEVAGHAMTSLTLLGFETLGPCLLCHTGLPLSGPSARKSLPLPVNAMVHTFTPRGTVRDDIDMIQTRNLPSCTRSRQCPSHSRRYLWPNSILAANTQRTLLWVPAAL
jgi:hypothetical protein